MNDINYPLDHLNSTKAITKADGSVDCIYEYRAFGEELKKLGDGDAKYTYGGKELDGQTNLYYFNARYYDATIGRFINVDPVQDGTNWYVYVNNNPLSFKDPTGLSGEWVPDTNENQQAVQNINNTHKNLTNPLINIQNNVLPHDYNGVEAIGRAAQHIPGIVVAILYIVNQDKIKQTANEMWSSYKQTFSNALDSVAKEKGNVSSEDLLKIIIDTNSQYSKEQSRYVSIFEVEKPEIDVYDTDKLQMTLCEIGFKGYGIALTDYKESIYEKTFVGPFNKNKEDITSIIQQIDKNMSEPGQE